MRFSNLLFISIFSVFVISFTSDQDKKIQYKRLYTINLPGYMNEMYDLNESASLQYGYTKEKGSTILEHYVIVIHETFAELGLYGVTDDWSAYDYWEITANQIGSGMAQYDILTKNPQIEKVNGMDCVQSEMLGVFDDGLGVFYKFAAFRGSLGYYQVLTWTISEQRDLFEKKMDKIISSFQEVF